VCETIVAELRVPDKDKTIKPANMGGIAGGLKYIHNGVLLKFAADDSGIYGGSPEGAGKAAKLEYNALQSLLEIEVPGLHVPLQGLVEVQGYRIIACALLPISNKTIVYGSSDGGITISRDTEQFEPLAEAVARRLYLKQHRVQDTPLWLAADVEGHRGADGRLYLLDTARMFPPEAPQRSFYGVLVDSKPTAKWHQIKLPAVLSQLKTECSSHLHRFILQSGALEPHSSLGFIPPSGASDKASSASAAKGAEPDSSAPEKASVATDYDAIDISSGLSSDVHSHDGTGDSSSSAHAAAPNLPSIKLFKLPWPRGAVLACLDPSDPTVLQFPFN